MQKSELTFDVIEVLKEAAGKFLPALVQKVRETLEPRDLKLFDYVFEPIFKLSAIFSTGKQATKVKGDDFFIA